MLLLDEKNRRARLDRTSGRAMSPAPEATELRPQQKRRKTAKDAGVSTFHPWSDPKHGVVFLKKHIKLGEDGTQVESKVIASRLFEALSRFGSVSLPAYEQTPEPGSIAADAHARQLEAMASGGTASESQPQYIRCCATFENFVEFMLPEEHDEKKRLRAVRAALEAPAEGNTDFRVTKPTDLDAFMQFLTFVTAPYEKVYYADAKYGSVPVHGRGNGYSAAKNYVSAVQHIDDALTGESNIKSNKRVKNFLAKLERDGPPVIPARAFDIAEVLPRWCGAIYEPEFEGRQNPFNTDILRIEVHTMFMTELATCARRSLFTKYCPRRDQVTLGPVDDIGIPKYYKLVLDRWKGNAKRKKKQTLLIKRNYINPWYCPVVAMTVWLKVLNDVAPKHKNGPLFPALKDNHNDFILDEEGHMQIISETQHSRRWDLAARYVGGGLEMCSTHGRRRSVVKWGARCGAQAPDLREAGRWVETSKDFDEYWRDGVGRRAEAIASGESDPIYSVWVWKPIVAPT